MRHHHARAVPAALARPSAGGSLCTSRGICRAARARTRAWIPSRRIGAAGAQLLPRLGARQLGTTVPFSWLRDRSFFVTPAFLAVCLECRKPGFEVAYTSPLAPLPSGEGNRKSAVALQKGEGPKERFF